MAEPDPPRLNRHHLLLHHRTAGHVLRHSLSSFLSSAALPALFLAAFLLFSFHSTLLVATLRLSALADRDPALHSLLRRLSSPSSIPPAVPATRHRARSAPLRLTGAGDFFSDPDPVSASSLHRPINISWFRFLDAAEGLLPRSPKNSKIRVPFSPSIAPFLFSFPDAEGGGDDGDRAVGPRNSGWELDLDRGDAMVMFYLLVLLSATHSLAILAFIVAYTSALGMVFYTVIAFHLQRPVSVVDTVYSGVRLGIQRLPGFVFLRWAARDMVIQFLSFWFFADVQDQAQLFKLFVKVKLMPFLLSPLNPWSDLDDEVLSGFFFVWALLDTVVSVVFAIMPWVVIMDHNLRRGGLDVVKEGFYLIMLMPVQAIWIKFLEMMICGNLGRLAAVMVGGRLFAGLFHAAAEVYFMAVWLTFYFVARGKDGELMGRRFGQRDMEDCFNELN
ncbi:hypothetical protein Cni_G12998 [Canna indica]|uniref:Uncharacterized protein n=1 Tax=Canna indica TaxID=4628 RepID=A0AAQ3KD66_9LILI|nr:hypothetical protein Cni_G12998 [Canna indica]